MLIRDWRGLNRLAHLPCGYHVGLMLRTNLKEALSPVSVPPFAGVFSPIGRWQSGGRALSRRDRIIIGLMVALFEVLAVLLLFLALSSTVAVPKLSGVGSGALLFAPYSGNSEQEAKDEASARKAARANKIPPATHVKNERANKHPDPPIPLTSEGDAEKLAQDSSDKLPDKGTSAVPLGSPDGVSNRRQSGAKSAGGGTGYDPYAGASPQYRKLIASDDQINPSISPEALSLLVAAWLSGVAHSETERALTLVESLRADVLRFNPNTKGNIAFEVLTDASGHIIDARLLHTSAPPKMTVGVLHMLIGRKIGYATAGWHSLPLLQFGT